CSKFNAERSENLVMEGRLNVFAETVKFFEPGETMPIFEFCCKACGKVFDKLQLAGREEQVKCPQCASETVEKKISAPFLPGSVGRPADSGSCTAAKANGCGSGG
ncbi:MAG: zinc ribbon domain-containing protein, partial [Firmicutes bacterium]|nr:zinc ribbon domain-containing protein [Bacillota bacterium]